MSKRARLSSDDARRAGLHAWETPEGRRWLLKALNPNDVSVAAAGIPTLQSRNISVLNWQGEYSVDVPANLDANNPSYDSTMFLYQHPLIFGMSATRPEGTMDMRDFPRYFQIKFAGTTDSVAGKVTLETSSAPSKPISMSRCVQYLNNQVDPSVFNGDVSLAGRRKLFTQLTQKNRITYGGATIIPTCSAEHNGGSLAVCQQVFSPRKSIVGNNNDLELDTFLASDFPDTSDLVQNPQMYYGRFQDGAYIPYKLHDPSNNLYSNSEQQVATRSPYFVKAITFLGTKAASTGSPAVATIKEVPAIYSGVNVNQFTATSSEDMYSVIGVRLYIQTYTGLTGHITFSLADADHQGSASSVFWTNESGTAKNCVNLARTAILEETSISATNIAALDLAAAYMKLPELVTAYDWVDASLLANPWGSYWVSEDITTQVNPNDKDLLLGTICPFNGQSLITIHISGASNTAPIKMLLRYGVEILLTASSPYSPFKFMSPRYDESAVKSYARCIRSMRDAYFANAGSIPGQTDYVNKLMALIENDSADDLNRAMNQGGAWTGVVGAY